MRSLATYHNVNVLQLLAPRTAHTEQNCGIRTRLHSGRNVCCVSPNNVLIDPHKKSAFKYYGGVQLKIHFLLITLLDFNILRNDLVWGYFPEI
jgi:hypothetical protein